MLFVHQLWFVYRLYLICIISAHCRSQQLSHCNLNSWHCQNIILGYRWSQDRDDCLWTCLTLMRLNMFHHPPMTAIFGLWAQLHSETSGTSSLQDFFGLQVEEVFREHSFEHQNITDIESRAIPNITVLHWVFRRMLKLGYFCSRTLHSYGGGCAESVNNNCNKQCNHLHFFLFYFV